MNRGIGRAALLVGGAFLFAAALLSGCGGSDQRAMTGNGTSVMPASVQADVKNRMGSVTGPPASSMPGQPGYGTAPSSPGSFMVPGRPGVPTGPPTTR